MMRPETIEKCKKARALILAGSRKADACREVKISDHTYWIWKKEQENPVETIFYNGKANSVDTEKMSLTVENGIIRIQGSATELAAFYKTITQ